jgi:hypothetical protein
MEHVVGARWVVEADSHVEAQAQLSRLLAVHVKTDAPGAVEGFEFVGTYQSTDSPSEVREAFEESRKAVVE